MVLHVLIDGCRQLEVDDLSALFLDTFLAALSPQQPLQHFYYEDEDGDLVIVRTDDEFAAMLSSSRAGPLRIHLRLVLHVELDRVVALKCMATDGSKEQLADIQREAQLLRKVAFLLSNFDCFLCVLCCVQQYKTHIVTGLSVCVFVCVCVCPQ
ncbi:unnamed protein product [Gongylonema pulchrum]|uniref:PB1 domain-containing protein n=1 Tax=Gongylonema pulchrum TaxID=637853 RepID=A0A183DZJ6_9BILA|nr:unnamed protein product [Gongylonema pulchrum]